MEEFPDPRIYKDIFPRVNVADLAMVDGAVGPGRRLSIWLQGCLWRCPGCRNALFLPLLERHLMSTPDLCALLEQSPGLAGVTLSGGEPLLQAEAVTPFLREVRRRDMTVVCYTGWKLERLRSAKAPPALAEFLSLVDLLIDGDYRADLPPGAQYCASSNQELRFLSGRITPEDLQDQPQQEFTLGAGKVGATGILPDGLWRKLFASLKRYGVRVDRWGQSGPA